MGNRTLRRHGLHFWPEGVLQGLQGFFLQIDLAEIAGHKTDQPDAMVDFLDADRLAFSLRNDEDVKKHAAAIYDRVRGIGGA